jgi:hypothetical protein
MVGGSEHLSTDRLEADFDAEQAGRDTLDYTPLPDGVDVKPTTTGEAMCTDPGTFGDQFDGVLTHYDAEVVFRFDDQPVRIDESEAVAGLEQVPLVDVAMGQYSTGIIMCSNTFGGAVQGIVDGAFGAGLVKFGPLGGDKFGQLAAFVGARRQPAVWHTAPHAHRGPGCRTEPLLVGIIALWGSTLSATATRFGKKVLVLLMR